jgi:hypothetical protein
MSTKSKPESTMKFSIDWPIGFRSRTCDPDDPCYMGSSADAKRAKVDPNERRAGWANVPHVPVGCRIRAGTKAWLLWRTLVRRGAPMSAGEIATHIGCRSVEIAGLSKRLVQAGAVTARHVGRFFEYAVGSASVVEVV